MNFPLMIRRICARWAAYEKHYRLHSFASRFVPPHWPVFAILFGISFEGCDHYRRLSVGFGKRRWAYLFPGISRFVRGVNSLLYDAAGLAGIFGEKRFPGCRAPARIARVMWLPVALLSALSLFFWFSLTLPFNAAGWFLHWIGQEHS